ncbi:phage holin family protein [Streptococcus suis]|uniref:Holin n=1 Tax=Streptococcus suis TaxID=1307 RepID=A0A0Z8EF92_STRSU|nr:phage holin [Streptococcus suis]MBY4966733.1 phage holin family protein [Streptococcus suis]MBY5014466.1 phage holin family protein [Streptococcus suis]MBY5030143.1 phage holin family protein [Streptococcus suis]MDG4523771.1 phage holin family protein [Streptococcus suis]MDW8778256.1 phage holin [Streptococcus suis]
MKLKERLKLHMFWIGLVSLILMLIDNIASSYFGYNISQELNKIEQTICIILSILLFLGILSNKKDSYGQETLDTISHKKEASDRNTTGEQ